MLEFKYRAITAEGRTISGRQVATSESDLEARLGRMQLELLKASPVNTASYFARQRLDRKEIINIFIHMQTLSQAGVPLFESLTDLRDGADSPRVKRFVSDLVDRIQVGACLSDALEQSPMGIDKVSISLVRTGEATGNLSDVLAELVESLKWADELAAQTKKLLMYPVFSALVVFGAIGFLMVYLVPQLLGFIKNIGGVVPIQTVALVAFSGFLVNFWYAIPMAVALVYVAVTVAARMSPQVRLSIDSSKLRIPVLGPVIKKIIMARFSRSFGLMYRSGIAVIPALGFCETLSTNAAFRKAVGAAAQSISQGQKISDAFAETALFPSLVVRMLRVGETTGGLDKALENVSYFYSREVNESVERLQEMIQPALTLVLGGTVIWIVSAVLLPIYDMISKIKL